MSFRKFLGFCRSFLQSDVSENCFGVCNPSVVLKKCCQNILSADIADFTCTIVEQFSTAYKARRVEQNSCVLVIVYKKLNILFFSHPLVMCERNEEGVCVWIS